MHKLLTYFSFLKLCEMTTLYWFRLFHFSVSPLTFLIFCFLNILILSVSRLHKLSKLPYTTINFTVISLKYLICEHYLLNNADSFRIFLRIQHIYCSLGISLIVPQFCQNTVFFYNSFLTILFFYFKCFPDKKWSFRMVLKQKSTLVICA
jgi:hypothetical protein